MSLIGTGAFTMNIGSPLVIDTVIEYNQCKRSFILSGEMNGQWEVFSGLSISDITIIILRR